MADTPKIITFNMRAVCPLSFGSALAAMYFGWPLAASVLAGASVLLLIATLRYKIASIGIDRRTLPLNCYQYTFLIKLADSLPESDRTDVRVFTFGVFLLADCTGKMKLGFLKRSQQLAKI